MCESVKVDTFNQNGYNFDARAWDKTAQPSIQMIKTEMPSTTQNG
jgi:hypothetical protein